MSAQPVQPPSLSCVQRSCVRMESFDSRAMRMALQDGAIEHLQLGTGVFEGMVVHAATDGLRTDWGQYNLPLQGRGELSRDMLTLGVLIGGDGAWRIQGAPAAGGDIVLLSEGGELLINLPARAQWLAVQVPRDCLANAGIPLEGLRGSSAWRMAAGAADASCAHLAAEAPALSPIFALSADGVSGVHNTQQDLLAYLLSEWERRRVTRAGQKAERLLPGERWRLVQRVEAYLQECPDLNWRIDELCAAAHTSLSTLERAFKESFGLTPRRYLALRRLGAVRNDLISGGPDLSITEVANRWGFYNHGRFALEYARLFKERPSQTRLRAKI